MRGVGVILGVAGVLLAAGPARAQAPADPAVAQHLQAWQQVMAATTNFYTTCTLQRRHLVLKNKGSDHKGAIICLKPNLAKLKIVRVPAAGQPEDPNDFMSYICTGKAVYQYDGSQKEMTEYLLRAGGGVGDNLLLEFISGALTADGILRRFDVAIGAQDDHYIHFQIKPRLPADKQEFEVMTLVLFKPGTARAYLPRTVVMRNPNGQEVERWDFDDPRVNVEGITPANFQPQPAPAGWSSKPDPRRNAAPAPDQQPRVARPAAP